MARCRYFGDDLRQGAGAGANGTGAGHVTHGAKAHLFAARRFTRLWQYAGTNCEQGTVAEKHFTFVGKIERGQGQVLSLDIGPDIQFRPIAQRKYSKMFTGLFATVVEIPELGSLLLGIPLAELVAVGKDAFFRSGLFLVAAPATEGSIEFQLSDSIQQGNSLQRVPAGIRPVSSIARPASMLACTWRMMSR